MHVITTAMAEHTHTHTHNRLVRERMRSRACKLLNEKERLAQGTGGNHPPTDREMVKNIHRVLTTKQSPTDRVTTKKQHTRLQNQLSQSDRLMSKAQPQGTDQPTDTQ